MAEKQRSNIGYGSSYSKGSGEGIKSVFGGQVWTIKPDRKAALKNPCIWMQAGVIENKDCNQFYDCTSCKYDLGMKIKVEKGKQVSWQDAMRKRPALDRICRHSLTHRIEKRACAYDYQCSTCDFDQFFEEVWTAKSYTIPLEIENVKGFNVPMEYNFHNGHTWARIESGGFIRIGLDDFSLKLLGQADAFDLPLMGNELNQDQVGWGLKRKNNNADVLSPVGGVIVEVNSRLREDPNLANRDPYGEGWLFMLHTPDIKKSVKNLMTDAQSIEWMNTEVQALEDMIENVAGPAAADGGYFTGDIYGALPDLGWGNLTKTFLKT